jgi:DNA repair protein RadC
MRTDASLQTKQSADRNLPCLSPRELIAELIGEIIAPDILANVWPTTLLQIIHLPEEDLVNLLGLSPESARRLAAAFELHRRIVHWSAPIRSIITTPEDVLAVMLSFCTHQEERFFCLALDARKRLICDPIQITMGDVDGTEAAPRAFFRAAVKRGAVSCVAVHNHPSGDLTISAADMAVTRRLVAAGRMLDVALVDHVVIAADRRWASLRRDVPDCFR